MTDLRAYARSAAVRNGVDPDYFERQIDQESGFNPDAHNPSGADGIAQIVVRAHPSMAGKTRDPIASLDYAAHLISEYLMRFGSYPRALAAYNWGSGHVGGGTWDGEHHEPWDGSRATLPAETQHYLDVILGPSWDQEATMPARVTFDPNYPAVLQNDQWSCAPTSLTWAMRSLGRHPSDDWIENDMLALNLVTREDGLQDHTGAGIVHWLQIGDAQHYGSDGYGISNAQCPITWDALTREITPAAPYPVLLGLPQWALRPQTGHWSGVRGYDPVRKVIKLANPDTGATYGQLELNREQFEARAAGNASIVRVLHPDLIEAAPPPVPAPAPPDELEQLFREIEERLSRIKQIVRP